jgi:hypothetical protein
MYDWKKEELTEEAFKTREKFNHDLAIKEKQHDLEMERYSTFQRFCWMIFLSLLAICGTILGVVYIVWGNNG